jgi:hypothetical protein
MFSKKNLVFQILLVLVGFVGVSVGQEDARCYTLASIKGTYATVGTYGGNLYC